MAAAFRSAGTLQESTGTLTCNAAPSGLATNDIELLICETSDEAVSLTTSGGFAAVPDSPVSAAGSGTLPTRLTVFWRRYSGQADPVTNDPGNHIIAVRVAFSGCILTGDPWDVTSPSSETTEDTSGSASGDTTTVDNTLVVCIIAQAKPDIAGGTTEMSSPANADLSGVTERFDDAAASGNGGWIGIITGTKASAGTFGATTWTGATASYKAMLVIALKEEPVTAPFTQTHFRVRSGDDQTLNADAGWAAALDTNVSMDVEKPFRIRFEVETNDGTNHASAQFLLQYNRNGSGWVDLTAPGWPTPTDIVTVGIIPSSQYADGDATTNILSGSSQTFLAGSGQEDNTWGALSNMQNEHSEFEVCLLIRKFFLTESSNPPGTTFQFRLVRATDHAVFTGTYITPTITVTWPVGLIGGCAPETPLRLLHRDGNGNLYCIIEYHQIGPTMAMVKSTDGGRTWLAVDTPNNPTLNDLECIDSVLVDHTIHIVHMRSQNTTNYHSFRVSTHPTNPDTWDVKDQEISPSGGDPVQTTCAIEVLSTGTIVAAFTKFNTSRTSIYYRRKVSGSWDGADTAIDTESGKDFLGIAMVRGANDLIHIVYNDITTDVWHRSLSGTTLSSRESLTSDGGSGSPRHVVTVPAFYMAGTDEKVFCAYFREFDNTTYGRYVTNDGAPSGTELTVSTGGIQVEQNAGGSQMAHFMVLADGRDVYSVWSENTSRDMYYSVSRDGAAFSTSVELKDAVTMEIFSAAIFTHGLQNGGNRVLGIVWDNGASGDTGFFRYDELVLAEHFEPAPTYIKRGS